MSPPAPIVAPPSPQAVVTGALPNLAPALAQIQADLGQLTALVGNWPSTGSAVGLKPLAEIQQRVLGGLLLLAETTAALAQNAGLTPS